MENNKKTKEYLDSKGIRYIVLPNNGIAVDVDSLTKEDIKFLTRNKMTEKRLNELQSEMSNETLIDLAEKQISELARTGGRSHRMCVPPMPEDTDMLFSELVKRFKSALANER
tara:strand:- start:184 stop:522 length:339 start_codon:yes stop_codon:yes gene_type:complete